jgi:hypothetical protein
MTDDQWRRLDAMQPSCLGCLTEDLRTTEADSALKQLTLRKRHLLSGARKTRPRRSCPLCRPRREQREQLEALALRVAQNIANRKADELLFGPD